MNDWYIYIEFFLFCYNARPCWCFLLQVITEWRCDKNNLSDVRTKLSSFHKCHTVCMCVCVHVYSAKKKKVLTQTSSVVFGTAFKGCISRSLKLFKKMSPWIHPAWNKIKTTTDECTTKKTQNRTITETVQINGFNYIKKWKPNIHTRRTSCRAVVIGRLYEKITRLNYDLVGNSKVRKEAR